MNIFSKDVQRIIGFYVWSESITDINSELKGYTRSVLEELEDNFTYSTLGCDQCHRYKIETPDDWCDACCDRKYSPYETYYPDYIFGWCNQCYGYVYLFSNGRCRRMWDANHLQELPEILQYCSWCKYELSSCDCWYDDPLLIGDNADFLSREYYIEKGDY